jgi:squalene-hopene/tetraprenyl-beta-curcumene cyclase
LKKTQIACERGFDYLSRVQLPDGSWLPLWFGNQFADQDENPIYGTARVLVAYRDADKTDSPQAERGFGWLKSVQNDDGGWGGDRGVTSSVEETALATEILLSGPQISPVAQAGLCWLFARVESGEFTTTTPIGFYFAKLWYFEELYPVVFCASALGRAARLLYGAEDGVTAPIQKSLSD